MNLLKRDIYFQKEERAECLKQVQVTIIIQAINSNNFILRILKYL